MKKFCSVVISYVITVGTTIATVLTVLKIKDSKRKTIKIKYLDPDVKIEEIEQGDWIDLKTSKDIRLHKGQRGDIPLGVIMKLPKGYEAHLLPRSSTCRKYNIMMENSQGIIDNSFCGEEDEWKLRAIATDESAIPKGARIAQFRIVKKQNKINFKEVESMTDPSRGGFGSTGEK